jgi:hypothetical protein
LVDALEKADPFILIPGSKTKDKPDGLYRMSECINDPAALSNLNDNIIYTIETSTNPDLKPAQEILNRIRVRDFVSVYPNVHSFYAMSTIVIQMKRFYVLLCLSS